eukprot:gene12201-2823_t
MAFGLHPGDMNKALVALKGKNQMLHVNRHSIKRLLGRVHASTLQYKINSSSKFVQHCNKCCNKSHQASPTLPNIEEFGWQKDNEAGAYIAKASSSTIAPKELLGFIKCGCGCKGKCETSECSCYNKRLSCTEMCHCIGCENTDFSTEMDYQDDEEDEIDD